jgi:predicted HTH transcriptional regulator
LSIDGRFNETAFKRYIKTAKISDVLEREAILRNLNCAGVSGNKVCFTNAGALFFRVNMVSDGSIEKIGDKRYAHYILKS